MFYNNTYPHTALKIAQDLQLFFRVAYQITPILIRWICQNYNYNNLHNNKIIIRFKIIHETQ